MPPGHTRVPASASTSTWAKYAGSFSGSRFLIDNNLSPFLADRLKAAGHDVVHVRDVGLQASTDSVVLERARIENRVLVSADTPFGSLLAARTRSVLRFC